MPATDRLHGTLDALVLKSLTLGPRHGFGILRWIAERTDDLVRVEEGSLYHYGNLSLRNISNIITNDLLFLDKKVLGFWLFKYLNKENKMSAINIFAIIVF